MPPLYYFSASFYAARAGIYFNRVLMVSHLAQNEDADISKLRELWFQDLRNVGKFYVQMIQQADNIYKNMPQLPPLSLPKYPDDYFEWAKQFLQNIRTTLTVGTQEECLFAYGFYLGNTYCNTEVLDWTLALHAVASEKGFDQQKQVAVLLDDLSDTQFKWGAPAMLLGRDEKLTYLWQTWRYIDDLIKQMHDIKAKNDVTKYPELARFCLPLSSRIEEESKKIFEFLQAL